MKLDVSLIDSQLEKFLHSKEPIRLNKNNFPVLGRGCYKIVSKFAPDIVIKFHLEQEEFEETENVQSFIDEVNIVNYFSPTYIRQIPRPIEVYDEKFEQLYTIRGLSFQPMINLFSMEDTKSNKNFLFNRDLKEECKIGDYYLSKRLINQLCHINLTFVPWLEIFLNTYRYVDLVSLTEFCINHEIYDIHERNVGLLNGLPVIFDYSAWIERSSL